MNGHRQRIGFTISGSRLYILDKYLLSGGKRTVGGGGSGVVFFPFPFPFPSFPFPTPRKAVRARAAIYYNIQLSLQVSIYDFLVKNVLASLAT